MKVAFVPTAKQVEEEGQAKPSRPAIDAERIWEVQVTPPSDVTRTLFIVVPTAKQVLAEVQAIAFRAVAIDGRFWGDHVVPPSAVA